MEPGVQTPEDTLDEGVRLVPRFGLAARAAAAAPGSRGALRVRLSDPARVGCEVARWPLRARRRISRTCTRGARCICPAPGWIGLDPTSGLLAGEGHIPLACTPEPSAAAPVSGRSGREQGRVRALDERGARVGSAARHQALHRRAVGRHPSPGPRDRCGPRGAGRAAHDGRRAHVRVAWTIRTARSGTPPRSGPNKRRLAARPLSTA